MVKNSKLEINDDLFTKKPKDDHDKTEEEKLFPELHKGMFIPSNEKRKTLMYIKFRY